MTVVICRAHMCETGRRLPRLRTAAEREQDAADRELARRVVATADAINLRARSFAVLPSVPLPSTPPIPPPPPPDGSTPERTSLAWPMLSLAASLLLVLACCLAVR